MLILNFDLFPVLKTERLLLRQVTQRDVNEIFFLRSDPQVMYYIDRPRATSAEEASLHIQKINELEKNNEAINWGIVHRENASVIGTICFWNITKEHHRAEIGYVLHPAYHGKGIMQEAMKAILDYGFHTLKFHSVEANVNPENKASIKILERNGFAREGYFKENYFYNDKFLDSAIYSLLTPLHRK